MAYFNRFFKIFKTFAPFIGMFAVIIAFHYTDFIFFKYYPVVVNFGFFAIFFLSTFKEKTVIQKIALSMDPNAGEYVMRYTRNLTYIWALFTFLNFLVSFVTVFAPKNIWMIYNGCISYILTGAVFVIEYIVRINFMRKYETEN